jgi:hypothetical protein
MAKTLIYVGGFASGEWRVTYKLDTGDIAQNKFDNKNEALVWGLTNCDDTQEYRKLKPSFCAEVQHLLPA